MNSPNGESILPDLAVYPLCFSIEEYREKKTNYPLLSKVKVYQEFQRSLLCAVVSDIEQK